jgi:MYXO-CTERM domain-containing protein
MTVRPLPLRRAASIGALAATFVAAWAAPDLARACSCEAYVGIQGLADGATIPANALLVMVAACGGAVEDLHVLVDGQPAALAADSERMAGLGLRIEPEPAPGALVELEGCPGWASCEQAVETLGQEPGTKVELSLTVGERDETAPAAPALRDFDFVLEDEAFPDDCSDTPPRPARDWSFTIDGQSEESPMVYHLSLGPSGSAPTESFAVTQDGQAELERTLRRYEEDAGSDVCIRVRAFDIAGNEAEPVSACQELARRETLDEEGCACRASGERHAWGGAAMLVLLGAWSRRRRRP